MAFEGFLAIGIFLQLFLGLEIRPLLDAVGAEAMIFGVEIGRQVFGVPARIILEQKFGRRFRLSAILAGVDAQRLQRGEPFGAVRLPHHDLVVPPLPHGRLGEEPHGGGLFAMIARAPLVDAVEGEAHRKSVNRGDGAAQVQGKANFHFVGQYHRDLPVVHHASQPIRPPHRQRALARGLAIGTTDRGTRRIPLHRRGGKDDLGGPGCRGQRQQQATRSQGVDLHFFTSIKSPNLTARAPPSAATSGQGKRAISPTTPRALCSLAWWKSSRSLPGTVRALSAEAVYAAGESPSRWGDRAKSGYRFRDRPSPESRLAGCRRTRSEERRVGK